MSPCVSGCQREELRCRDADEYTCARAEVSECLRVCVRGLCCPARANSEITQHLARELRAHAHTHAHTWISADSRWHMHTQHAFDCLISGTVMVRTAVLLASSTARSEAGGSGVLQCGARKGGSVRVWAIMCAARNACACATQRQRR